MLLIVWGALLIELGPAGVEAFDVGLCGVKCGVAILQISSGGRDGRIIHCGLGGGNPCFRFEDFRLDLVPLPLLFIRQPFPLGPPPWGGALR